MKTELLDDEIDFPNNDENFSHEYASLKYRAVATFIDFAIIALILSPSKLLPTFYNDIYLYLFLISVFVFINLYFIVQECGKNQSTFGKRFVKLIVTDSNFNKITVKQSFIRTSFKISFLYFNILQFFFITLIFKANVVMSLTDSFGEHFYKLIFIIPTILQYSFPILLVISILYDKNHIGIHDKIAKTNVLREIDLENEQEIN